MTARITAASHERLVGRRELQPPVERKWWAVEYLSKAGTWCALSSGDYTDKNLADWCAFRTARDMETPARVVEVVERRTELIRHDGTQPPNDDYIPKASG